MEVDKAVEDHLRHLEGRLLHPEVRKTDEDIVELLAEDFIEFESSGRIFHRDQIIEALRNEPEMQRALTNFKALVLAPDLVLATYRAIWHRAAEDQPEYSLRSSIWKLIDGRWCLLFHQGTLVKPRRAVGSLSGTYRSSEIRFHICISINQEKTIDRLSAWHVCAFASGCPPDAKTG
jgi:hypothetical protein